MTDAPIVTLTTDFGERDYYVGAMKGVILSINPDAKVVDLSHEVRPQDILGGAFLISRAYRYFPPRTVHCIVVDPGVGTARRPLVASVDGHHFVAPDNGVLSLILDRTEDVRVVHATASHYYLAEVSQTFHGRDIFAPLSAWLSRGIQLDHFGDIVTDYVRFKMPKAHLEGPHLVRGAVIQIDHFGNCVTNIPPQLLPDFFSPAPPSFKFRVGTATIEQICTAYAASETNAPFIIPGSSDFLEISLNRGSAADSLKISRGAEVEVTW
ncbi:MAG: S-adenosyl-l-methionine hydroxide adenosyltransferase family protein [Terriglobia bacterium]